MRVTTAVIEDDVAVDVVDFAVENDTTRYVTVDVLTEIRDPSGTSLRPICSP